MKLQYFNQKSADRDDIRLKAAIQQGYVPKTCLLGGAVVWSHINEMHDPCEGCNGPRDKCKGRPKLGREEEADEEELARIERLFTGETHEDPFKRIKK